MNRPSVYVDNINVQLMNESSQNVLIFIQKNCLKNFIIKSNKNKFLFKMKVNFFLYLFIYYNFQAFSRVDNLRHKTI